MRTDDICALSLGLTPPWQVLSQRLDTEKAPHELHVALGTDRGGAPSPADWNRRNSGASSGY